MGRGGEGYNVFAHILGGGTCTVCPQALNLQPISDLKNNPYFIYPISDQT